MIHKWAENTSGAILEIKREVISDSKALEPEVETPRLARDQPGLALGKRK